ncbi:YceI family protein [Brevundimonas sp.]
MSPFLTRPYRSGPPRAKAARSVSHFKLRHYLALRSLEPLGADRYTARADVTIKGVTRPLAFPVDLRLTDGRAHLTGAFVVDRTQFGIGTTGPWNRLVDRRVTVRVQLQARPA